MMDEVAGCRSENLTDAEVELSKLLLTLNAFCALDRDIIQVIADGSRIINYEAGDTIYSHGEFDGEYLIGVLSGHVRAVANAQMVGDIEVSEYSVGDTIGLLPLIAQRKSVALPIAVTSMQNCQIVFLESSILLKLLENDIRFSSAIATFSALNALRTPVEYDAESEAERRILRHLLSLVEHIGSEYIIQEMPRHAELAERCGVTDMVAAAAIADLLEKGVVRRSFPQLIIKDMPLLRSKSV